MPTQTNNLTKDIGLMDVFLLGAGRPASGKKPSALKKIALNTKALDWQIHSFSSLNDKSKIHFLGGYHVDKIIQDYPQLNYTVIPDWNKHTVLHTLLQAPFSKSSVIISYSDTVFRKEVIDELLQNAADVVFGFDSQWPQRYQSRSKEDIDIAEKVSLEKFNTGKQGVAEFTGLIHLKPPAIDYLSRLKESDVGSTLLDLLHHFQAKGFRVNAIDVNGHWAELNSPLDIAHFILGTKAETLARLEHLVRHSRIGKQVSFTSKDWLLSSESIVSSIIEAFRGSRLIVRSSSKGEDNWKLSNAGSFESRLNVEGQCEDEIRNSISAVIQSYSIDHSQEDQILVQEFLQNVQSAGVVFTCGLETGSPYYILNFDDKTQSTQSITSGTDGDFRTILVNRKQSNYLEFVEPKMLPVLRAIKELEELLGFDKLDIEFALDRNGIVHIFQVRPITVDHSSYEVENEELSASLADSLVRFRTQQAPSPFVFGNKTIFGNMADWNPAEIIGARPKPLAFSLYRHLITNEIWAAQRAEFGYRDVRPYPLILAFSGQPYVDIRASLNSFIPDTLPDDLAKKLAQTYLNVLIDNPHYHDKIEFDVAFTIWTQTFEQDAVERLLPYGIKLSEIEQLGGALKNLTCKAFHRLDADIAPIDTLSARRAKIEASSMAAIDKFFALIDDCNKYGTLAFAHAARAGFVATSFLKSFVSAGVLTEERRLAFMANLKTVVRDFEKDKLLEMHGSLSRSALIERYGHLRPGTYEVTTQAYWENPERYLICESLYELDESEHFAFTSVENKKVQKILSEMGSNLKPVELADYLRRAIQAREAVKFEFTRNLSRALDTCVELACEMDLTRNQVSYLEYHDLEQLKLNAVGIAVLKSRVEQRMQSYTVTQLIELPSLITQESDFYCFERHASQPNFITTNKIQSRVQVLEGSEPIKLTGKIVLVSQADPGFDWLFGHNIGGLITKFGGANSHMAIRAAEIGLPAAIGVGEKLYERVVQMRKLELDCANKIIREIL